MKINLVLEMYSEIHNKINFFKDKPPEFVALLAPLLVQTDLDEDKFIFREGDNVNYIYFMLEGQAAFVLNKYSGAAYI